MKRIGYIAAQRIKSLKGQHIAWDTEDSDKTIRLNSRTYTSAASIVGFQSKPRAGVAMTNDIMGAEIEPGMNAGYATTGSIIGVKATPYRKGNDNCGGEMNAFRGELGTDSGYSGTVTGPVSVLRGVNNVHGTITNGVYVIYVPTHGGNKAWDGLALLPEDGQIASAVEPTTLSGWVKVKIGANVKYIGVYTNPS